MCVCVEVNEGEASGDHLALADTHLLNQHQQGETGRSAEIMACTAPAYTHTHTHVHIDHDRRGLAGAAVLKTVNSNSSLFAVPETTMNTKVNFKPF